MSGMAEVLDVHRIDHRYNTALHEQCVCGRRWMVGKLHFETHLEDVLAAAGFGPVKEAGAKALEEAADEAETLGIVVINPSSLRARAATVRGEG